MKKILLSSVVAMGLASTVNAGVIVDFEAGAGMWSASPSGEINYDGRNLDLENDLGLDSSTNNYLYADFSHFVPLIPNVRVERQELKVDATKQLANAKFGDKTYNENTTTSVDLTQNDLILYWNIPGLKLLTAGILKVDFGIDLKQFDGSVSLDAPVVGESVADMSFVVPMGYVAATVDPPFIPATISASYKTLSYDGSSISDMMAKLSVNLPIPIPLIDIKADIGYKEQSLVIDPSLSDTLDADIKFKGMFFGLSAKF